MNDTPAGKSVNAGNSVSSLIATITDLLEDAKSEDIVTIDLRGKTAMADAMIIASGRSKRHVGAVADQLMRRLKEIGRKNVKVEGLDVGEWVLIDVGDVIVHVFQPEIRDFYNLEKMWTADRPDETDSRQVS